MNLRRSRRSRHATSERSITSISWIPSEAVEGLTNAVFEVGFTHYDGAPPDAIGPDVAAELEELRVADRFRFANHLAAAGEFDDDGRSVEPGYTGGGPSARRRCGSASDSRSPP